METAEIERRRTETGTIRFAVSAMAASMRRISLVVVVE